jgi:hypothetical protein
VKIVGAVVNDALDSDMYVRLIEVVGVSGLKVAPFAGIQVIFGMNPNFVFVVSI